MVTMSDDPTERSLWRPVFRLLQDMDEEIARVYADNGIADLKTNWVPVILKLHSLHIENFWLMNIQWY